ncbi:unnamed protein product [Peniophora sp. CBMAI 1063]|nr:unnamed protein product [Peniophora sp. CBMAI 1063]
MILPKTVIIAGQPSICAGSSCNKGMRQFQAEDEFWSTYLEAAREEDEWRPKDWDGNTGSILTFTGLFAATVAAFVIESYKSLAPDSGDQTVELLTQLLAVATNGTSSSSLGDIARSPPFAASTLDVLANAFWFCSLSVSLVCALLATLIQQWSRDYVRDIRRKQTLDESIRGRAFNHIYVRMGVNRYGMDQMVSWLVALVHLAVALFAAGLFLFLYSINSPVAICATTVQPW